MMERWLEWRDREVRWKDGRQIKDERCHLKKVSSQIYLFSIKRERLGKHRNIGKRKIWKTYSKNYRINSCEETD